MFFDFWRDYTEDEARARLEHEKETISREAWVQKESALQDERDQFFQELQALEQLKSAHPHRSEMDPLPPTSTISRRERR